MEPRSPAEMPKPRIAIIGPGRVGGAIGRLLRQKRYPISGVAAGSPQGLRAGLEFIGSKKGMRSAAAARTADVVFLTTPDRLIRPVCEEIARARGFRRGAVVFHCCGAHGPELLAPARQCKAYVGALHPLQSFAAPEEALRRFKGTYFTFDGDAEAAPAAKALVGALGGTLLAARPHDRALYHAACCVLSNYVASLADLGVILLQLSGLPPDQAAKAAQPLLEGTVENIGALGLPQALTGPIARGDVETVERHVRALGALPRDVRRLYSELGLYTVRVAQRKGTLNPPEARHLVRILQEAQGGR